MQLHLPNRPGNGFHTHNGDKWEAIIEGEITFTVKGQAPRLLRRYAKDVFAGVTGAAFQLHNREKCFILRRPVTDHAWNQRAFEVR
jgi:hypothetical protein